MMQYKSARGVWLSRPNSSWSGGKPLRSAAHPYGVRRFYTYVRTGRQKKIAYLIKWGNSEVRSSGRILKWSLAEGIPTVLELPRNSLPLQAPSLQKYLGAASFVSSDFCRFGCDFQGSTVLACWSSDLKGLAVKCTPRNDICSETCEPHQFSGRAQSYLDAFVRSVCGALNHARRGAFFDQVIKPPPPPGPSSFYGHGMQSVPLQCVSSGT